MKFIQGLPQTASKMLTVYGCMPTSSRARFIPVCFPKYAHAQLRVRALTVLRPQHVPDTKGVNHKELSSNMPSCCSVQFCGFYSPVFRLWIFPVLFCCLCMLSLAQTNACWRLVQCSHTLSQCTRAWLCTRCCMAFRVLRRLILQSKDENTCRQDITNSVTLCEALHLCNSFL